LIKYEDLICSTELTLKKICKFLKINFEEEMLNYLEGTRDIISSYPVETSKKHLSLMKPLDAKMIDKWQTELTKKEIGTINYIVSDLAKELGYKLQRKERTLFLFLSQQLMILKFNSITLFIKLIMKTPFWMRKIPFRLIGRY
jgi:hypothetical protein